MRLDKYLADCNVASRREAKKIIRTGVVTVNGEIVENTGENVDEKTAVVCVNGEKLFYKRFVYIMLNKPAGCVSAREDKRYPTVLDYIDDYYKPFDIFPVGRLDVDTEGLLLITNDGKFAHSMLSPHKNVYKRYFAVTDRPMEEADIEKFAAGMEFKEFTAKSARLELTENPREVYIEIAEGKYHQVKRMVDRVGKAVNYLKRVAIGPLKLDETLAPGESRELTDEELALLKAIKEKKMDKEIKACVFDLDGTLTNTINAIAHFGNEALVKNGFNALPVNDYKKYVGDGRKVLIERILRANNADIETNYDAVCADYDAGYEADPLYDTDAYEGIRTLLTKLKKRKIKLAVCTNKPDNVAHDVIRQIFGEGVFDFISGVIDGQPTKPAPDSALRAAAALEVTPEECVFIGDTNVDIKTGKNAGMTTVGVLWGFRDYDELNEAGAEYIIENPKELLDLI